MKNIRIEGRRWRDKINTVDARDAEQIVRSVNAFPALLKACKMGLSDIERLYTGQEQSALYGNAAFKALKAAIKEAEAPI